MALFRLVLLLLLVVTAAVAQVGVRTCYFGDSACSAPDEGICRAASGLPTTNCMNGCYDTASPGSVTSCDGVPDLPCTAAGGAFTGFYYSSTCEAGSSTTIANATTTVADNLANQVCCDADAGSRNSAPTIIACTDYPEGRVGRFWSGQIVCLSNRHGGYPKTAAGCASLHAGDECLPFGNSDGARQEGGKCEEDLSTDGERCGSGDSCWTYPYLVCVGSSAAAGDTGSLLEQCDETGMYSSTCQAFLIIGIVCGVACLCGGLAYLFLKTSTPQEGGTVAAVGGMVPAAY